MYKDGVIETGEVNCYFGPTSESVSGRLKREVALINHATTQSEPWTQVSGCYDFLDHHFILNLATTPLEVYSRLSDPSAPEPPTFHNFLQTNLIPDILERARQNQRQAILLDIGGGTGFTWQQAANQYQEEVKKGEIVFVVSNLAALPAELEDKAKENLSSKNVSNFVDRSLVQYVRSPFRTLAEKTVVLPDGTNLQLRGNVDLVHESWSLTAWSCVPELDILVVPELLTDNGIYAVSPQKKAFKYADLTLTGEAELDQNIRTQKIVETRAKLTNFNLYRVTNVEAGFFAGTGLRYTFFKKPQAPAIRI